LYKIDNYHNYLIIINYYKKDLIQVDETARIEDADNRD